MTWDQWITLGIAMVGCLLSIYNFLADLHEKHHIPYVKYTALPTEIRYISTETSSFDTTVHKYQVVVEVCLHNLSKPLFLESASLSMVRKIFFVKRCKKYDINEYCQKPDKHSDLPLIVSETSTTSFTLSTLIELDDHEISFLAIAAGHGLVTSNYYMKINLQFSKGGRRKWEADDIILGIGSMFGTKNIMLQERNSKTAHFKDFLKDLDLNREKKKEYRL